MLPAARPLFLSTTQKVNARPAAWSASMVSKNTSKSSSLATPTTKYRHTSPSRARRRSAARSAGTMGRSRTLSSWRRAAAMSGHAMSAGLIGVPDEAAGDIAHGAHVGEVLLGEVRDADPGLVAHRGQEKHHVERGEPVLVDHVAVRVDVLGRHVLKQAGEIPASHCLAGS